MTSSSYHEFAPPPRLAPVVRCVWTHEVGRPDDGPADVYEQPVLPDACLDLVVADGRVIVAGPATVPVLARMARGSVTVGVRFRTGAAPAVLGVAASELRDLNVALGDLWGAAAVDLDERCAEIAPIERLAVLLGAVAARLADGRAEVDRIAVDAAGLIAARPGRAVPEVADRVGLSDRQLRRRLDDAVGYSPRTLARIVRFQRFLAAARAVDSSPRDLATLAIGAGYSDQAHLTRESVRLAGQAPGRLLAAEAERLSPSAEGGRPNRSRHDAAA